MSSYDLLVRKVIESIDKWCESEGSMICMMIRADDALLKTEISVLKTRSRENNLLDDEIDEVRYSVGNRGAVLRTYKGNSEWVVITGRMRDMVNAFRRSTFRHVYYNPSTTDYIITPLSEIMDEGIYKSEVIVSKLEKVVNSIRGFKEDMLNYNLINILDRSADGFYCEIRLSGSNGYETYLYKKKDICHHTPTKGKALYVSVNEKRSIIKMINGICSVFDDVAKIVISDGKELKVYMESEPTYYMGIISEDFKVSNVDVIRY